MDDRVVRAFVGWPRLVAVMEWSGGGRSSLISTQRKNEGHGGPQRRKIWRFARGLLGRLMSRWQDYR